MCPSSLRMTGDQCLTRLGDGAMAWRAARNGFRACKPRCPPPTHTHQANLDEARLAIASQQELLAESAEQLDERAQQLAATQAQVEQLEADMQAQAQRLQAEMEGQAERLQAEMQAQAERVRRGAGCFRIRSPDGTMHVYALLPACTGKLCNEGSPPKSKVRGATG